MVLLRFTLCCMLLLLPTLTHAKIVFTSFGSGIYVMDDDGRNAKILIKKVDGRHVLWPHWSPDGKQIAFLRSDPPEKIVLHNGQVITPQSDITIFIINSDGTGEYPLTGEEDDEWKASWSPDGKHMVFTSDRLAKPGKAQEDAWRINIETKALQRLTRTVSLTTDVSWSPDGKYIAYRDEKPDRSSTIFLMRPDGSGQHEFWPGHGIYGRSDPRWSVDSKSVLYIESRTVGNLPTRKVVIQDVKNGKRQVVDTPNNWLVHSACFMGSKYLLISAKPWKIGGPNVEEEDIYRYHRVTGEMINLTNRPDVIDIGPDWIDDDVLSVSPKDKKKMVWGKVKQQGSE